MTLSKFDVSNLPQKKFFVHPVKFIFGPYPVETIMSSINTFHFCYSTRFGSSLRYIELPIELITHTVFHELANKCHNLTHMLLDFSTAMQLHDFSEMQAFPTKLKYMCICLSEVIFMEGFMRKIYNFINGLEILHLIGMFIRRGKLVKFDVFCLIKLSMLLCCDLHCSSSFTAYQ